MIPTTIKTLIKRIKAVESDVDWWVVIAYEHPLDLAMILFKLIYFEIEAFCSSLFH